MKALDREIVTVAPQSCIPVSQRDYDRHTVDIDRQPMSFEDVSRSERIWGWCVFWALVGAVLGYVMGRWVLPHVVGH